MLSQSPERSEGAAKHPVPGLWNEILSFGFAQDRLRFAPQNDTPCRFEVVLRRMSTVEEKVTV